jgi:hypothetical protein
MSHTAELQSICNLIGQTEFDRLVNKANQDQINVWDAIGYRNVQSKYVADTNNGSYYNNTIEISTETSSSQWYNLRNTKVRANLSVGSSCPAGTTGVARSGYANDFVGAGVNYGPNTPIAFNPMGSPSMFSGIKVSLKGGANILNVSGAGWYKRALDFCSKYDQNWLLTEGSKIGAWLPSGTSSSSLTTATNVPATTNFFGSATTGGTVNEGPFSLPTVEQVTTFVSDPTTLTAGLDTGFQRGVALFQTNAKATSKQTTNLISFSCDIGLEWLHDLFKKMDLPLTGMSLIIELTFASQIQGVLGGNGVTLPTTQVYPSDQFTAFVVPPNIPPPGVYIGNSVAKSFQLIYDSITLAPSVGEIVNKRLLSPAGLLKEFTYDTAENTSLTRNVAITDPLPRLITSATSRIKSFTAFITPAGSIGSYHSQAPILVDNSFPQTLSYCRLIINDTPLYVNDFQVMIDYYNEFSKSFNGDADGNASSMIDLFRYQSGVGSFIHYDVSHLTNALQNHNNTMKVELEAPNANPRTGLVDFYPLLVTEKSVTFSIGTQSFVVTSGNPL